jgi:hypothetical protein
LYKFGQRYYESGLGRWTQLDDDNNALDTHGWNRYVYAGDDPVNFTDALGLDYGHNISSHDAIQWGFALYAFGRSITSLPLPSWLKVAATLLGGGAEEFGIKLWDCGVKARRYCHVFVKTKKFLGHETYLPTSGVHFTPV